MGEIADYRLRRWWIAPQLARMRSAAAPAAERRSLTCALSAHFRSTDRTQLKLRYGHHHKQPQQQSHYDELDPFRSGVREPSKQFVEATHCQPPSGSHAVE